MSENKEMSLQQYITAMRNQIILSYDNAKEIALRNFDEVSKKMAEVYVQLQNKPADKKDKKQ